MVEYRETAATSTGSITIEFNGCPEGEAPLSWSQQFILEIIKNLSPHDAHLNLDMVCSVPQGVDLAQAIEAVGTVVRRFDALRLRVVESDTGVRQRIVGSGSLSIAIFDGDDESSDERAEAVRHKLSQDRYELDACGLLLRSGIVLGNNAPRYLVCSFSHILLDGLGIAELKAQLRRALLDPSLPAKEPIEWRSLDQADHESSPAGLQQAERAISHWRDTLKDARLIPTSNGHTAQPERHWQGELRSPAMDAALALLSDRLNVSSNSILLATLGVMLGRLQNEDRPAIVMRVSNRFSRPAQRALGHLSQDVPIRFDTTAGQFATVVQNAARAAFRAYRHASYPPTQRTLMLEDLATLRGRSIDLGHAFNCTKRAIRASDYRNGLEVADLDDMVQLTSFKWIGRYPNERITSFFYADDNGEYSMLADTEVLPPASIELSLRSYENTLVAAARGEDRLKHLFP